MQWDPPAVSVTQDKMIWVEKAGEVLYLPHSDKSKRKIHVKADGTCNDSIHCIRLAIFILTQLFK